MIKDNILKNKNNIKKVSQPFEINYSFNVLPKTITLYEQIGNY